MQTDHDHEAQISHEVRRAVTAGRKIEAVKLLREQTGMGLFDAKEYVRRSVESGGRFPTLLKVVELLFADGKVAIVSIALA